MSDKGSRNSSCQGDSRLSLAVALDTTQGLGLNPREDIDVYKYIVPSRHAGTLNSHRAASPLVRLVAGDERWEAPDPPPGCPPSKLRWNRAKSYCHLFGATSNNRRTSSPLP
ncbi:hypothetical protein TNCV_1425211 [Trichonephila clavipes]|nr:hypothetical protein TNCV_1425211 [Trichonephila clavipes]